MKCRWIQDRLLLYLAEELESAERARITEHLAGCEACAALLKDLAECRATLCAARTTALPPASLDARILQRVRALPRRRFPWTTGPARWNHQTVFALAGSALLLMMAGYQWGRWSALPAPLPAAPVTAAAHPMLDLAALADTHRAWAGRAGSADTGESDVMQAAARLARQTGLHIMPPDRNDRALRLKDSAVVQMKHIPVAMLHYDWNGIPVSLAQADGLRLAAPSSLHEMGDHGRCFLIHQKEGLTFIFWCEGTDNFVLVARVPPPRLFALACTLCAKRQRG